MKPLILLAILLLPLFGVCELDFRDSAVAKYIDVGKDIENPTSIPDGIYILASSEDASFCLLALMSSITEEDAIKKAGFQLHSFFEVGDTVKLSQDMPVLSFDLEGSRRNLPEWQEQFFREYVFAAPRRPDPKSTVVLMGFTSIVGLSVDSANTSTPYRGVAISTPNPLLWKRVRQAFSDEQYRRRPFWKKWEHWLIMAFFAYAILVVVGVVADAKHSRKTGWFSCLWRFPYLAG